MPNAKYYWKNPEMYRDMALSFYYDNHNSCLLRVKNYREKNNYKVRMSRKKAYKKNRRKYLDKQKEFYLLHKDRWRLYAKNRNKEKANIYKIRWAKLNLDKVRLAQRNYYERNKDRCFLNSANYRARIKKSEGSFTLDEWFAIRNNTNGWCKGWKCEPHFVGIKKLTKDHIIPIVKGGSNYINNIQPLCRSCNCSKNCRMVV